MSSVGAQQGDSLEPLCFSLSIHSLVKKIQSSFNVFHLDDGTIGDDFDIVLKDFQSFVTFFAAKLFGHSDDDLFD